MGRRLQITMLAAASLPMGSGDDSLLPINFSLQALALLWREAGESVARQLRLQEQDII